MLATTYRRKKFALTNEDRFEGCVFDDCTFTGAGAEFVRCVFTECEGVPSVGVKNCVVDGKVLHSEE